MGEKEKFNSVAAFALFKYRRRKGVGMIKLIEGAFRGLVEWFDVKQEALDWGYPCGTVSAPASR